MPDPRDDFARPENPQYRVHALADWDPVARRGRLAWRPAADPAPLLAPIQVDFVGPTTLRLRLCTQADQPLPPDGANSSMLAGPATPDEAGWRTLERDGHTIYTCENGFLKITRDPFHLELWDPAGRPLIRSFHPSDDLSVNGAAQPFAFLRRAADRSRRLAASFRLQPDDRIYGGGESFTRLDKRGQLLPLWAGEARSAQTPRSPKPVPVFLGSRGWGLFLHTSGPVTADLGHSYDETLTLYSSDDTLDLFLFLGGPKDVLGAYTALTGRSPLPPLWSFGLWMSRASYRSEAETREVAASLRHRRIPCDVIHLDRGWSETDDPHDPRFAVSRFTDPRVMLKDLRLQGFRISLGYRPDSRSAADEALSRLFDLGVATVSLDADPAATGLDPLPTSRRVAELCRRKTGHSLVWTHAAWAGSQRYPVPGTSDAEPTDSGLAATLRAGLSLGLCGFSFWGHDIGGTTRPTPRALYRRWLAFGVLSSHCRCHGAPPTEPWHYDPAFVDDFRRAVELRYRLLPYLYAQAKLACDDGLPLLRPLFLDYSDDPTCWRVEDQYLLGRDLLIAPLLEESKDRLLYLPPGHWIDLQGRGRHAGGAWRRLVIGEIPCIILVREGAVIPWAALAQYSDAIDWTALELEVYAPADGAATGQVYRPGDAAVSDLRIDREAGVCLLHDDPLAQQVTWTIRAYDHHV